MNKSELVQAVKAECRPKDFASNAAAERAVAAVFNVVGNQMKAGEEVTIQGFGTFTTVAREARVARNISTGETIEVPAKVCPKFKASKKLKDAVAASAGEAAE